MRSETPYWRLLFLSFLVFFFGTGCGSDGDVTVATGTMAPEPAVQNASIRLESQLEAARAVPAEVTSFRLVGFDAQGSVLYSASVPKSEEVVFSEVSPAVVLVNIQYLVGNTIVGLAIIDVELVPGQQYVISNPDFEDVGAVLERLNITPIEPSIAAGTSQQFTLTGTRSTGEVIDLTNSVTWESNNTNVATVDNAGLARSSTQGQTEITARFGELSVSTTLTVTQAVVTGLQVTPPSASIPFGGQQTFVAEATFSDQSVQDVSGTAVWGSDAPGVATMNGATAEAQGSGSATVTATFGGQSAQATLTVGDAPLVSIAVTPSNPSITDGASAQLIATGTYADNTSQNLTSQVTWGSNTPAVASVNPSSGLVTGQSVGTAGISATLGSVVGNTDVQVTNAVVESLVVTPTNPGVANGFTQQFTAVANLSNGDTLDVTTQANWSSGSPAVATVGMTTGLAQSQSVGSAQIQASFMGQSDSATLVVTNAVLQSIAVTPASSSAPRGTNVDFMAVGTYSDGTMTDITDQVNWNSNATNLATILSSGPNAGRATAVNLGTVQISANLSGVTGNTDFEVTAAVIQSLTVTPTNASIADGLTQQFTAVANFSDGSTQDVTTQARWSSNATAIATVGVGTGLATGESQGSAQITATFNGQSDQVSLQVTAAVITGLTVTPVNPSIPNGTQQQFTATASFSNGSNSDVTNQASWTSSVPGVATITTTGGARGLADADAEGSTAIQATFMGQSDSTNLTVTAAELVSLTVTPTNASVADGLTQQFTAVANFTDASTQDVTTQATWASDNTGIATIGLNTGLATAQSEGTAQITATFNGQSNQVSFQVTAAVITGLTVTPVNPSIPNGTQQQFTATASFSNGSNSDVTNQASWTSSVPGVATVTTTGGARGLADADAEGSTTIQATFMGQSDSTTLTVTAAELVSLTVTPTNSSVANGLTQQFTAVANFTDGSTQDVTTLASWSSNSTGVATVGLNTGLATGQSEGSAQISATFNGQSDQASLEVTAAVITSLSVTPLDPSIPNGTQRQFTATANFSDGSSSDVTNQASWTSSVTGVATITTTGGARGLADADAEGNTTIQASFMGQSGSTTLTVTAAALVSLNVTPDLRSVPNGLTQQYQAVATFTDGSMQDITTQASWSSDNVGVATIGLNTGLATAQSEGTTDISATFGGQQDSVRLTVTPAIATSVVVTPTNSTIPNGTQLQFTAVATFSDGSSNNVTNQTSWSSSVTGVATITTSGTRGLATANAEGSTTIQAAFLGQSDTTTLTVGAAEVASVAITPVNPSIPQGGQVQFTATATFTDGSMVDVTNMGDWTSASPAVATVTTGGANRGLAMSLTSGTSNISFSLGAVSDSTTLTVDTMPIITSIQVTPNPANIGVGVDQSFTATATFGDNSTGDVTNQVTWSSSNTGIVTIDSGTGVASGQSEGSTTVQALDTVSGVSGTATVNVERSLTTTFASNNNQRGIMFDVTAGTQDVSISNFFIRVARGGGGFMEVETYFRVGSYADDLNNLNGSWSLLATNQVLGGTATNGPISPNPVSITVPAGQTYGFFFVVPENEFIIYSNGNGTPFSNADVTITPGPARDRGSATDPFNGTVFNGRDVNTTMVYSVP